MENKAWQYIGISSVDTDVWCRKFFLIARCCHFNQNLLQVSLQIQSGHLSRINPCCVIDWHCLTLPLSYLVGVSRTTARTLLRCTIALIWFGCVWEAERLGEHGECALDVSIVLFASCHNNVVNRCFVILCFLSQKNPPKSLWRLVWSVCSEQIFAFCLLELKGCDHFDRNIRPRLSFVTVFDASATWIKERLHNEH